MSERESTGRGGGRRQRPRTVPDLSLSPVDGAGGAPGANRTGTQPSAAVAAAGRGRRARPVPTSMSSKGAAADAAVVPPVEQPELLSRFIPADPWVGRVSLSSPQAPGGLPSSSTTSPNPAVANGTVVLSGSGSNSTNEHAGGAGAGAGRGGKGVVGLVNEGNSCYLNASLQALARCTPFRAHLVECVSAPDVGGRPCPLAFAMSELFSEMWAEGRTGSGGGGGGGGARRAASPSDVLRALVKGNRWFAGNGQHDAHEALRSILDLLHEELRRPVPASFQPGHAALAAAMAASAAESAAAAAATAPATAAPDDPKQAVQPADAVAHAAATDAGGVPAMDNEKLRYGGKVTIPSTPADGAWSVNGGGVGVERRSTERVNSGDAAVAQHRDVYWQSAAAETFQGVLLGRITCRTCGRHSDQPDRFYDLSVPLLAANGGSASIAAANGMDGGGDGARVGAINSAAAAAAAARGAGAGQRSRESPGGGVTPTMVSPRPEWEPSDNTIDIHGHGAIEKRMASARSMTTAAESEGAGGDRTSDWGGWRRTRGGWCSAARDDGDGDDDGSRDSDGSGGRRGRGGGGGASRGYFGGLVSSVGVWLGFKSVALEDCLEAFFSPERLRGANQYHCDCCGTLKEADKSTSLLHAPEILMLHVKRFRRGYLWSHKVYNRVIFPLHDLDVSRWLSDHAAESSVNKRAPAAGASGGEAHRKSYNLRRSTGGGSPDGGGYFGGSTATAAAAAASESVAATFAPSLPAPVLYDLVGLVQHTGGLEHGHYTSYTRDDGSATWYHFNDTVATKVSQETVSSASPYILVYRRKRPSPSWSPGVPSHSMRSSAEATASAGAGGGAGAAASTSLLASVGIGPAAEEARDVRSRVDIMAREMSKANGRGGGGGGLHRAPSSTAINAASSSATGAIGADAAAAAAAAGESQARMSIGGGVSDTDGEGAGGGGRRLSTNRRRKGRGRRPGSESESEGGTGGSNSWVYMSKAWALKWATSAYPGPVSNHHVVCRHGRVKPNVGVKRAAKEMVAVPRGVHRSLVNRYGPRTPAVVAEKPDANGFKATPGPGESAGRVSVGRGRGRGQGMALVGSSRPLLELVSCPACAALEKEMALAKSTEQKEVAALSKVGQERRKRRKAARLARQRRRNSAPTPESDPRRASRSGMVVGAAGDVAIGGKEGSGDGRAGEDEAAARNSPAGNGGGGGDGGGGDDGGKEEERAKEEVVEQKEELKEEQEETSAKADDAAAADGGGGGGGGGDEKDEGEQSSGTTDPGGSVSPGGGGVDGDEPDEQQEQEQEQPSKQAQTVGEEEEGEHCEEEEEEEEKWYLMAGTWLSRWHAYVLSGTGEDLDFPTPPPGPITNGDLVNEASVPIPGKIAGKHYRGAMTEVWSYLHERSLADPADAMAVATAAVSPRGVRFADEDSTATDVAAAIAARKPMLRSKKPTPTVALDDRGAGKTNIREERNGRRTGPAATSTADIPEGANTYHRHNTSSWVECKRAALNDFEKTEIDRARLESDFLHKNARMQSPRNCGIVGGVGLASFGEGSATKGRKRSHSDGNDNGVSDKTPPTSSEVTTTDNTIRPEIATGAKHDVGSEGTKNPGSEQEEGYRPTLSYIRSWITSISINASSEQEETRLHARGHQAQCKIIGHVTSQAAESKEDRRTAQGSKPTTAALETSQGVDASSSLAVATRNVNDAIESAKHASAALDAAKAAFDLSAAVRNEAETAIAHRNAVNNAGPYVSWVNNEVANQRSLQARAGELMFLASQAWDTREEARKELLKAGDRVSRAARVFGSFSSGDGIVGTLPSPNAASSAEKPKW
eukprot:g12750.t1